MGFKTEQTGVETLYPDTDGNEINGLSEEQSHLRTMVGRAAMVYLLLFGGLGLVMSALDVDPLVNNGLMPKLLLVFVGLALLIAVASRLTDLSRALGRNLLRLGRSGVKPNKKWDE